MVKIVELVKFSVKHTGKKLLCGTILMVFIQSICKAPAPIIQKCLIDAVSSNSFPKFKMFLIALTVSIVIQVISSAGSNYVLAVYSEKLALNIRRNLIVRLFDASYEKLKKNDTEYLHNRIKSDSDNIANFSKKVVDGLVSGIPMFIFSILYLVIGAPILIIVMIVLFLLFLILYFFCNSRICVLAQKFKEENNRSYSIYNQAMTNISTIKLNGMKVIEESKLNNAANMYINSYKKLLKFTTWFLTISSSFQMLFTVLVLAVGSYMVMYQNKSIGDIFAIVGFSSYVVTPIVLIIQIMSLIPDVIVSYDRIKELDGMIEKSNEVYKPSAIETIDITIESMNFDGFEILGNIVQHFEKGKIYLVGGTNGCGKSTLLNILVKLHNNYQGEILINGNLLLEEVDKNVLYERIAYVEQSNNLFNGTIFENIVCFKNNHSNSEYIPSILKKFASSLYKLPGGLDTNIIGTTASTISGGEMRKVSILRGLCKSTDVIIMDEPTVSLDDSSVMELFHVLESLKQDHIVIVVSHDVGLYQYADELLLINTQKFDKSLL